MRKIPGSVAMILMLATHACALGAGFYLWTALREDRPGADGNEAESDRFHRSSSARSEADGERSRSGQLMERLLKVATEPADFDSRAAANNKRIIAAADALDVAADRKAAALAALAELEELKKSGALKDEDWLKMSARFLHWMREDPRGVIAYLSTTKDEPIGSQGADIMNDMMLAAISETDAKTALTWFGAGEKYDAELKWMLADKLGETTDLVGIAAFKEHFAADWPQTRLMLARKWPIEQADAFASWAASEGSPELLARFAMAKSENGEEGGLWLVNKLASGSFSDEEKQKITASADFRSLMWRCRSLDYDFRLGTLQDYYSSKAPERMQRELSNSDVGSALEKGRDWRYAFASGTVTAEEVYAGISATIPNVAANAPDAMRDSLFSQLAEEDGARAMQLLDSMPPEKKWSTALSAMDGAFHEVNPQTFYDYLQNIPPEVTDDSLSRRFNAWNTLGRENHERLGDNYVEWVNQLPQGLDRDMASLALIQSIGKSNPTLSEKLASGIHDPRVKERLPKSP